MSESRAAIRYAKAVLELSLEKKQADTIEADMQTVADTIAGNAELQEMLSSPIIKSGTKQEVLTSIFGEVNEITTSLINTLTQNKRISLLREVALKYIALNEKLKGKGVAYVTTAVPLTRDIEEKVLEKISTLNGQQPTLENRIDESIIGGFVLRIGDLQYDASIANKLNKIKREFTNTI